MKIKENTNSIMREVIPSLDKSCLYIVDRKKKSFTYPIHVHPECELNFVEHAAGAKRIIGDNVEYIDDIDLALVSGADLEHCWEQGNCTCEDIREITLQFPMRIFESGFINTTQFDSIKNMIEKAKCGLCFSKPTIMDAYHYLDKLAHEKDGFEAVIIFLKLMHILSLDENARVLSSSSFAKVEVRSDSRRVQRVINYIKDHYKEEIRLKELAHIADMSEVGFSRFFSLRTNKSVSNYIIDYRIGEVIRLLLDTTMTVSEIGYECGFNNISNFNRIFHKRKGCSPKEFRELYKKEKRII